MSLRHMLVAACLVTARWNPEPDAELSFWTNKAMNLNSIHSQLGMDNVKKVSAALRFPAPYTSAHLVSYTGSIDSVQYLGILLYSVFMNHENAESERSFTCHTYVHTEAIAPCRQFEPRVR